MRIFLVSGDVGVAPDGTKGAAVHLRDAAAALSARGHEVVLFSARAPAVGASLPVPVRPLASGDALCDAAAALGAPDLVIERYALGHDAGLAAARRLGAPFLLEVNAPLVEEARRHRPLTVRAEHDAIEARLLREADLVGCVSRPLVAFATAARGKDDGVFLLRNGGDPGLFPEPAPLHHDEAPVLVFSGHPKPWHGADRLLPLLSRLRKEGFDPRLLVIGGGEGADRLAAQAREAGLAERLEVTGPLPHREAARRLAEGTVAVAPYPSHANFYFCPLKVIEAMIAGVPVVTTAQGDLPEIVGRDGVLVAPDDDEALARAVADLLAHPRERHVLARRARARALATLGWDANARAIEAAFRMLRETRR